MLLAVILWITGVAVGVTGVLHAGKLEKVKSNQVICISIVSKNTTNIPYNLAQTLLLFVCILDFCSSGVAPENPDDSVKNIMVQLNLPQTNPDIYEYVSYHIHVSILKKEKQKKNLKLHNFNIYFLFGKPKGLHTQP